VASRFSLALLCTYWQLGGNKDARTEGYRRLLGGRLLGYEYQHEYAELGRYVLPLLHNEDVEVWESSEVPRGVGTQHPERDRQKSLAVRAGARLAQFVNRYGEPPHPDFPSYSSSWSGPDSPVAAEELAEKSVDEVLALLTSWKPEGSEAWGASKDGLAQTFQGVVASRAEEFSSEAASFAQLDPTYVRALFSGLTDAVNAGSQLDWDQVLNAARIASLNPDGGADFEGRIEEDVVWRHAQRAVASLLERGTSPGVQNGIAVGLLERALDAIAPLINQPDPTPEHEEQYGGSNMDPLPVLRRLFALAAQHFEACAATSRRARNASVVVRRKNRLERRHRTRPDGPDQAVILLDC
jgi:hypothetical protein